MAALSLSRRTPLFGTAQLETVLHAMVARAVMKCHVPPYEPEFRIEPVQMEPPT